MLEQLGMLASGAIGRIGDALDTPRRLAWSGINSILGNENGPENGGDLLSRAGMDPDSVWTKALGMGVDALTDPLTYAGGFIGRGIGKAASAIGSIGKPGVANVLKARRQFSAVKDIGFPKLGEDFADAATRITQGRNASGVLPGKDALGRMVGPMDEQNLVKLAGGGLDDIAKTFEPSKGKYYAGGAYNYKIPAAFTPEGAPREYVRHELMHGLNHQAAEAGSGLSLPSRLAGKLSYNNNSPFLSALGFIGDEALAHGAEARGLGNQLSGSWDFLMHPAPHYTTAAATASPAAAELWKLGRIGGRAAPWAAAAGVPAAAGAAFALANGE